MALDMSKYSQMVKNERKLPIIFFVNENECSEGTWFWTINRLTDAIKDIMSNLRKRNIEAVMSLVTFGDEVHLWSEYKKIEDYTDNDWPTNSGKSQGAVFDVALTLVKDMLEDKDVTPVGNYDPIVIFLSSGEVAPNYEKALAEFNKDGRFINIQKIGVACYGRENGFYSANYTDSNAWERVLGHLPHVVSEFAGDNVAVYIDDKNSESWWVKEDWGKTENKDEWTWFCPVLDMMELRYTEEGTVISTKLSGKRINSDPTRGILLEDILASTQMENLLKSAKIDKDSVNSASISDILRSRLN